MRNSYVIDSNILFSSLLSRKEFYRSIFIENEMYTPDFALVEIEEYKQIILGHSDYDANNLKEFTLFIFSRVIVVPGFIISKSALQQAINLCKIIDSDDYVYVALAIELNNTLITRDKPLCKSLQKQGFEKVMLFDQFVRENIPPK